MTPRIGSLLALLILSACQSSVTETPTELATDTDTDSNMPTDTADTDVPTDPDPVERSDTNSMLADRISITPMDADMTAGGFGFFSTAIQLRNLQP